MPQAPCLRLKTPFFDFLPRFSVFLHSVEVSHVFCFQCYDRPGLQFFSGFCYISSSRYSPLNAMYLPSHSESIPYPLPRRAPFSPRLPRPTFGASRRGCFSGLNLLPSTAPPIQHLPFILAPSPSPPRWSLFIFSPYSPDFLACGIAASLLLFSPSNANSFLPEVSNAVALCSFLFFTQTPLARACLRPSASPPFPLFVQKRSSFANSHFIFSAL